MAISVLILTLNEEQNLPACLASVSWSDDIVVFDSFSVDRTAEIAKAAGARVVQRRFDNCAAQRNAALTEVAYKHPWVLMMDADERATPELRAEIGQVTTKETNITLWRVRRKDMFQGRWLKRSNGYPTWFGRLFRLGHVWVEREINEEYHTDGRVGWLKTHLVHYPFSKGVSWWLERHNRYSAVEADVIVRGTGTEFDTRGLFSGDPTRRRKSLKQLAYRLPFRPFLVFCYWYFFCFGFLDGIPGLTYCRLRSIYEYMIDLKVKELKRRSKGMST